MDPPVDRARAAVLTDDQMLDAARWGIAEGLWPGSPRTPTPRRRASSSKRSWTWASAASCIRKSSDPRRINGRPRWTSYGRGSQCSAPLETDLVRLGVSPHAPYTVHEDLLIDVAAFAVGAKLPVAIHLAESVAEIAFLREGSGPFADGLRARGISVVRRSHSPVHLLVELGVVLARPLLIHCVQVDATDIAFIAQYDCPVAHCPGSNAVLGHGIAPVRGCSTPESSWDWGRIRRPATTGRISWRRRASQRCSNRRGYTGPVPCRRPRWLNWRRWEGRGRWRLMRASDRSTSARTRTLSRFH